MIKLGNNWIISRLPITLLDTLGRECWVFKVRLMEFLREVKLFEEIWTFRDAEDSEKLSGLIETPNNQIEVEVI